MFISEPGPGADGRQRRWRTVCGWIAVWPAGGGEVNSGARWEADHGRWTVAALGVWKGDAWNGDCLTFLPSYAPAALWLNGPSRACGGSWGPCSAWSSQGSDRHRASVTSEGQRWGEAGAICQAQDRTVTRSGEGAGCRLRPGPSLRVPSQEGGTQPALPTGLRVKEGLCLHSTLMLGPQISRLPSESHVSPLQSGAT